MSLSPSDATLIPASTSGASTSLPAGDSVSVTVTSTTAAPAPTEYTSLQTVFCSTCRKEVSTDVVEYKAGNGTYLCSLFLCCLLFLPGLIPCCFDRCKDEIVHCPDCKNQVAVREFKPLDCSDRKSRKF